MAIDTTGTILTLINATTDGLSLLPLYSAIGLSQTMEYEDGALDQDDTVNGELVDLSLDRFRKVRSVISANTVKPPSRDDVRPGLKVICETAYIFSYPTIGGSPARTLVEGSQRAEGGFTFYRARMLMMIGRMTGRFEEWEAGYDWSMELREVIAGA